MEKIFISFLEENNKRKSFGREAIARIVGSLGVFSAKELYEALKKNKESVSIASIHNTIPLLREAGLIEIKDMKNNCMFYERTRNVLTSQALNNTAIGTELKKYCAENELPYSDYCIKLKK